MRQWISFGPAGIPVERGTAIRIAVRRLAPPPARIDGFLPLRGYALISDGRSCALVGADGAIDWWPLPTMDCPPTFGALLAPERGGRLTLRPVADFEMTREYADNGAVLSTTFCAATGTVRVTDALNLGAGRLLPWSELARRVECLEGEVAMRWYVVAGDGFGRLEPRAYAVGEVPMIAAGDQRLALVLDGAGEVVQTGGGFRGDFVVRAGERAMIAVIATDGEPVPVPPTDAIQRRIHETTQHWAGWSELIDYDGPWRDAVVRSVFVHQQLTLAETGALQAAATTSLPEAIGGKRNFDYRYSWVRDTGFALTALARVGLRGEVHATLSYLLRAVGRTAPDLRIFYTMDGNDPRSRESKVAGWSGYRGSSPVVVGNKAANQRQLGNYGDLMEALERYVMEGNVLNESTGVLVAEIADQVCRQWERHDSGLWELQKQRPYTSSKLGCWAALDRSLHLAERGQVPGEHAQHWRETAEQIRSYITRECCSPRRGNLTFYAGTEDLDCATLLAARIGLLNGDDPQLHATIDAVRHELSAGGPLLYRYSGERGREGAFIACSFWLVEALTMAGRLDEARELMDAMVELANDVGLFSEEIDPESHELLGNMPQTLSHLTLINAAVTYHQATRRRAP